ncbi:MAG: ABC transporter ATP-binding protein [Desulfitobacteriaceae bacterium]|nr:ABC transporter ATP-binding protein [Desulfitobacteriaceae bacterium]MDD4751809.1 ABC transporter ATP-binding protein [Desulfitobacteriaceae bacterium]
MPEINVQQLDFSYGDRSILENLNFEIASGSFITIIGPNGSGKSTLLKNLSASLIPQKGAVLLDREDIYRINKRSLAKQLAVVPQDNNVDFEFSVLESVLMGRMPHQNRFTGDDERDVAIARWAMELTGTWDLKDRYITTLSGGELQRVVVARALTQEPKVLLLDEPTSHLDIQYQYDLLELLRTLNRTKGLTIVAVLHDLNLAAQFSDQVILLNRGKIMAYGPPVEVLTLQNIKEVYQIEAVISQNEITGRFNIIPLGKFKNKPDGVKNIRVHLVCGGGKGAFLMDRLYQHGFEVSCGVLNVGDTDWHKARELGLEVAEEAPFAPVSPKAVEVNRRLIKKSDVIVVLPVPIGKGNLANLEEVLAAQVNLKKKVVIIEQESIDKRDFTGGTARKLISRMIKNGACTRKNPNDVMELVDEEINEIVKDR